MTKSHVIDYAEVLSDLKAKLHIKNKERETLLKAIESIENIVNIKSQAIEKKRDGADIDVAGLGVYEATAVILEANRIIMKTKEIYEELLEKGAITKDTKFATVAATLYKAVSKKKISKIRQAGRGAWELNPSHNG